jgi:hypothetical protein
MKFFFTGVAAALTMLMAPALEAQQISYTAVDLGALGGNSSAGSAVNSSGQVTGAAFIQDDAAENAFISGGTGRCRCGIWGRWAARTASGRRSTPTAR